MLCLCFHGSKSHVDMEDVQDYSYQTYVVLLTGMHLNRVFCILYAVYSYCETQNETLPEPNLNAAPAYDKDIQPSNVQCAETEGKRKDA